MNYLKIFLSFFVIMFFASYVKSETLEELTAKAQNWDSEAQYKLGDIYFNGDGVDKNYKEAFGWYSKSAMKAYVPGEYKTSYMHDYGYGTDKNYKKAFGEIILHH